MANETDTPDRRTSWQLARLAETADPDAADGIGFPYVNDDERAAMLEKQSPGAQFLRHVEYAALELAEELADSKEEDRAGSYSERANDSGRLSELADSAVPVYTHERWKVFVDLAAYDEDTDELAGGDADMTQRAGIALYMVAERLAAAILEEIEPDEDDEDD